MGVFPEFGVWINQNSQQPPKDESNESEDVESNINYHVDKQETMKQLKLWKARQKKYPWHDYPPKVKVIKTENPGERYLNMRFTVGLPPEVVFDIFNSHDNQTYSYFPIMKRRTIMENKSKRVLGVTRPQSKIQLVEKAAEWKFLWWSGTIPINLSFNEDRTIFTTLYTINQQKPRFLKKLTGKFEVKPWYINNDEFCKPRLPKDREEYIKCTGRQGLIGSKVTWKQVIQPRTLLNVPPISWYINKVITRDTKALAEDLQIRGAVIRSV